jgi:hypothetical protein
MSLSWPRSQSSRQADGAAIAAAESLARARATYHWKLLRQMTR